MTTSNSYAELDRQRHHCILWQQARDMVRHAVRRGWMAYPLSTRFDDDGRPVPRLH